VRRRPAAWRTGSTRYVGHPSAGPPLSTLLLGRRPTEWRPRRKPTGANIGFPVKVARHSPSAMWLSDSHSHCRSTPTMIRPAPVHESSHRCSSANSGPRGGRRRKPRAACRVRRVRSVPPAVSRDLPPHLERPAENRLHLRPQLVAPRRRGDGADQDQDADPGNDRDVVTRLSDPPAPVAKAGL
jgi:hypothetical protein